MKILFVNKFLHPNGGSETYIFKLGDCLKKNGHKVQYFGMDHEGRCVGNSIGVYTSDPDFYTSNLFSQIKYAFNSIYSIESRRKIRLVLDDFKPDIVHLNNFNYQLTPSIILEIVKWRKESSKFCRIVATAHDCQLVCPNHRLTNPNTNEPCEKCLNKKYINCTFGKCIHGSVLKSFIGSLEAYFWNKIRVYKYIDKIICPSIYLKSKLDTNSLLKKKTVVLRNFIEKTQYKKTIKKDFVLYFGRFSTEKGINTLLKAVALCPNIQFVFAGSGPLEKSLEQFDNIKNVGFLSGKDLDILIREARFSLCPSEVNENCPFSVMESEVRGTPVIGANVGGIPELIEDGINGRLFPRKDSKKLAEIISELWSNQNIICEYIEECKKIKYDDLDCYYNKLMKIYT